MAGHSKWNNIKNRKGAVDAKRGKVFSQLSKLIRIAVKEGGSGDPQFNPSLRTVLDKARAANMPKDNIQKAIERGLGKSASGQAIQEVVYEAFGPAGSALLIVAQTDNLNRTSGEIKFALSRNHGSLGSPGSASYLFTRNDQGEFVPNMPYALEDPKDLEKIQNLIEVLRENEDVEDIYASVELPDMEESS